MAETRCSQSCSLKISREFISGPTVSSSGECLQGRYISPDIFCDFLSQITVELVWTDKRCAGCAGHCHCDNCWQALPAVSGPPALRKRPDAQTGHTFPCQPSVQNVGITCYLWRSSWRCLEVHAQRTAGQGIRRRRNVSASTTLQTTLARRTLCVVHCTLLHLLCRDLTCPLTTSLAVQLKRVGRGIGSGHGKTSGRGHKGQKARSGARHCLKTVHTNLL